jgi:hypothetical protein
MFLHDFFDDAQPGPGSFIVLIRMEPFENPEDLVVIFRINPDAVVLDIKLIELPGIGMPDLNAAGP